MHIIKTAILLASLSLTTTALADVVPVIDAYQDNPSASQTSNNSNATPAAASSSASSSIVSSSDTKSLPMEQRVTILERQVANLSQLLVQFGDMQQQVQDLRGKLEVQKHDVQVMQEQMRSQYQDLDKRLAQDAKAAPTKAAAPAKPKITVLDDNVATNDAAPVAAASATGDVVAAASAPAATDNGDAAYQSAYDLLTKKKYAQATTAFQSFIKKYPNSKNMTDAHYWLGMMYVVQGQPENAVPQFQTILKKSPQNKRVPDATYQLAMAYYARGDAKRAMTALKLVQEKYPDSSAAKYAKNRMQQIQQSTPPNGTA